MTDYNVNLLMSLDGNGVEAGRKQITSSLTHVRQAMTATKDDTALMARAMEEAVSRGMKPTERQLKAMADQYDKVKRAALGATTPVDRLRETAHALGVGVTYEPMIAELEKMKAAASDSLGAVEKASRSAHSGMAGISRELMVMGHEAVTGQFSRLGGSAMVLGERLNILKLAMSPVGGMLTVLAGAAAWAGYSAYEAGKQFREFNAALQMTSNYAGMTLDNYADMSKEISAATHSSLGDARTALLELGKTGQYTGDEMKSLATLIMQTSHVSGQSLEEVVKEYAKLAEDPKKWAEEHNKSMHFMDEATYAHIKALVEAGDKHGAIKAVIEATTKQVEASSVEHLGAAAKAWNSLKSAISETMAALGRTVSGTRTVDDEINRLEFEKQDVASSGAEWGLDPTARIKELDGQITVLKFKKSNEQIAAMLQSLGAQSRDAAIAAGNTLDDLFDQYATNAEKRKKALDTLNRAVEKVKAQGKPVDPVKYANAVAKINDDYKDSKPRQNHAADHQQQNALRGAMADVQGDTRLTEEKTRNHLKGIANAYDTGAITQAEYLKKTHDLNVAALDQEVSNAQKRADLARGLKQLSAAAQANADLRALMEKRRGIDLDYTYALQKAEADRAAALQKYRDGQQDILDKQRAAYADEDATRNLSPRQRADYMQLAQLAREQKQAEDALRKQFSAPNADKALYREELQALADYAEQRRQIVQQGMEQEAALRNSIPAQIKRAFNQLTGDSKTSAEVVADAFTTAWQASENALNEFLSTGKADFHQFASALLADLAKIALKWAEMQAMQSLMNSFGNGAGGSSGSWFGLLGGAAQAVTAAAGGGHITGPGTGTSDSIPAMLSNGEFVVNAHSTKRYRGVLEMINSGRLAHFASGGAVGGPVSGIQPAPTPSSTASNNPVNITINHNGGGGLNEADAKQLHDLVQAFVDKRMAQKIRGQGGYAYQIRHGMI